MAQKLESIQMKGAKTLIREQLDERKNLKRIQTKPWDDTQRPIKAPNHPQLKGNSQEPEVT